MSTPRTLKEIDAEIAQTKKEIETVKGSETEVYARIVGYYRSVRNWNKGKRNEYDQRKMFEYKSEITGETAETENIIVTNIAQPACENSCCENEQPVLNKQAVRYELFIRQTCPNCPPVKEYMAHITIPGDAFDVDSEAGFAKAQELGIMAAPTVVVYNAYDAEIGRAHNVQELEAIFEAEAALC
ncbi:MAG: hypothetical protein MJ196_03445 [Treponemataceae bacterium]|nr:hypothetical protein [Treponemataceae bacterium]